MLLHSGVSKRSFCDPSLDTALTIQFLYKILISLRALECLLPYTRPGTYVCCSKVLKRVLLTSTEYKISLCRLYFYFAFCCCSFRHGTAAHFNTARQATSPLRPFHVQLKDDLPCARSFLTFLPAACCGFDENANDSLRDRVLRIRYPNLFASYFIIRLGIDFSGANFSKFHFVRAAVLLSKSRLYWLQNSVEVLISVAHVPLRYCCTSYASKKRSYFQCHAGVKDSFSS
jgi:hypothetical protein